MAGEGARVIVNGRSQQSCAVNTAEQLWCLGTGLLGNPTTKGLKHLGLEGA